MRQWRRRVRAEGRMRGRNGRWSRMRRMSGEGKEEMMEMVFELVWVV